MVSHPGAAAEPEQGADRPGGREAWRRLRLTVSCYQATMTAVRGKCDSCRLRAEGFAAAGVATQHLIFDFFKKVLNSP
jgi:7-cyano-7-deazaguanine synthase in queuosine biosynthesis